MKSRNDLIQAVYQVLTSAGEGQSVPAEDGQQISDRIDTYLPVLAAKDIVTITDADAIDEAFFDLLTSTIAAIPSLMKRYGVTGNERLELMQDGKMAERDLRRIQAGEYQGYVLAADYF